MNPTVGVTTSMQDFFSRKTIDAATIEHEFGKPGIGPMSDPKSAAKDAIDTMQILASADWLRRRGEGDEEHRKFFALADMLDRLWDDIVFPDVEHMAPPEFWQWSMMETVDSSAVLVIGPRWDADLAEMDSRSEERD